MWSTATMALVYVAHTTMRSTATVAIGNGFGRTVLGNASRGLEDGVNFYEDSNK